MYLNSMIIVGLSDNIGEPLPMLRAGLQRAE
jgi:hypothetical protein